MSKYSTLYLLNNTTTSEVKQIHAHHSWALGTHTPSLVFCYPCKSHIVSMLLSMLLSMYEWVMTGSKVQIFLNDLDVGACIF